MVKYLLSCFALFFIMACSNDKGSIDEEQHKNV